MVGVEGVEGGCTVCPLHQTHREQPTQAEKEINQSIQVTKTVTLSPKDKNEFSLSRYTNENQYNSHPAQVIVCDHTKLLYL